MKLFEFWLFMAINVIGNLGEQAPAQNQTVTVELYYESMCPDCAEFMKNELIPVWKSLGRYFTLDLVPYGNAYTTGKSHGKVKVLCQHGEDECQGNIMHACALKYFTKAIPVEFISCTEKLHVPPVSLGSSCAKSLGLDFKQLQPCMVGPEGFALLVAHGERTNKLVPPHKWVPWILFNGVSNEEDMHHAEKDLQSVICKYLNPPPTECNDI